MKKYFYLFLAGIISSCETKETKVQEPEVQEEIQVKKEDISSDKKELTESQKDTLRLELCAILDSIETNLKKTEIRGGLDTFIINDYNVGLFQTNRPWRNVVNQYEKYNWNVADTLSYIRIAEQINRKATVVFDENRDTVMMFEAYGVDRKTRRKIDACFYNMWLGDSIYNFFREKIDRPYLDVYIEDGEFVHIRYKEIVSNIYVLSPLFKTIEGISVGDNLTSIFDKLGSVKLRAIIDEMGSMGSSIDDYVLYSDEHPYIGFVFSSDKEFDIDAYEESQRLQSEESNYIPEVYGESGEIMIAPYYNGKEVEAEWFKSDAKITAIVVYDERVDSWFPSEDDD